MQTTLTQKTLLYALLILIGVAIAGCEKLGGPQNAPDMHTIPAAMGELVAVTPSTNPHQAVLWFRQADQTIVALQVNTSRGTIYSATVKFPRS